MGLNILYSPGEQKVSVADPLHNRTNSAIAGLTDGGWVVTWTSNETTSGDIYERRYTKAGVTSGGDIARQQRHRQRADRTRHRTLWRTAAGRSPGRRSKRARRILPRAPTTGPASTSGSDLIVASGVSLQRHSSVAAFPDNDLVVAWVDDPGSTVKVVTVDLSGTFLTDVQTITAPDSAIGNSDRFRGRGWNLHRFGRRVLPRRRPEFVRRIRQPHLHVRLDGNQSGLFAAQSAPMDVVQEGSTIIRLADDTYVAVCQTKKDGSGFGIYHEDRRRLQRVYRIGRKSQHLRQQRPDQSEGRGPR